MASLSSSGETSHVSGQRRTAAASTTKRGNSKKLDASTELTSSTKVLTKPSTRASVKTNTSSASSREAPSKRTLTRPRTKPTTAPSTKTITTDQALPRNTSSTVLTRREKTKSRASSSPTKTSNSAVSSPTSSPLLGGRAQGARAASAAKIKPLKIPQALKSNISFTELKKQNKVLLDDIDEMKSTMKDSTAKHSEEVSELNGRLATMQESVNELARELQSKSVRCDAQETRANELQSKLSQAEMDKERLVMVLEGSYKDALTGREIADLQQDGANKLQMIEDFKSQTEKYDKMLNSIMSSLQQSSNEMTDQFKQIQELYNECHREIFTE